ncbi:membrane protein insertion efficiency factor YidD [Streptomyces sp. NPDC093252]|uniref:membrane protein insertion efficiency factor YidD n=1 Tax=Streptomyces sp. NPDC093252 TaxID=3154980 RepID=UPI003441BAFB
MAWRRENHNDRRDDRRRQKPSRMDKAEGCADGCSFGRVCCPDLMLVSLLTLVMPGTRTRGGGPVPGAADHAAPRPGGRVAGALYDGVRQYRTKVSPTRPACCPYTPTCSTYAVQALHRHGALRGARLTLGRLLRCRPGAARRRGFQDPVPE